MARQFVLKRKEPVLQSLQLAYEKELNPQQLEVVTASEGATLVIAGAGTGKTRTLMYRVAYLIETGTPPEQILLLTFTRRAAKEMLSRASLLLDGRCEKVCGGTFHAFCLTLLHRYAPKLGYPKNFNIIDSIDAGDVIDVLRTLQGLHQTSKRFPKKGTIHTIFSGVVNRQIPLADFLEENYPQFLIYIDELLLLHEAYQVYKKKHGLFDYDDLLVQSLKLLEEFEDIREQVGLQCKHVLVDEYQDTNRLQAQLVQHFASVHHNVMAVGDDAQSIYRFRGADFRNIMDFPKHFPAVKILKLEQNYRSVQPVLDLANHVLRQAKEKYQKELFSEKKEGELPALVQAQDEAFQSRFVTQMVMQLREEGVSLNRMAVLFRNSRDSFDLEVELNKSKIPFVKYGGLKLSDTAHIKDVIAHLRVLENVQDVIAWQRILLLLEGIGPRTAQEVMDWIAQAQEPFGFAQSYTSPRYVKQLKKLALLLQNLRNSEKTVQQQVEAIVGYYEPLLARAHPDDLEKRKQDLEHFIGIAGNFGNRQELLTSLALDPIERSAVDANTSQKDEPPLILSTIHSAKGLEFHSVFVIQALDGVLPSTFSLKNEEALDEELRLLYVALTRAEENLFIAYPMLAYRRSVGDYLAKPSRFLDGIAENMLETWQLVEEGNDATLEAPETKQLPDIDLF